MEILVQLLALAGVVALALRLFRSGFRLAWRSAEVAAISGLADVSARRGDLTAANERRDHESRARRLRRTHFLLSALWLGWLAVPLFFGVASEAYALAAALWLLPSPARRGVIRFRRDSDGA